MVEPKAEREGKAQQPIMLRPIVTTAVDIISVKSKVDQLTLHALLVVVVTNLLMEAVTSGLLAVIDINTTTAVRAETVV